jgi:Acyl-CoA synthetases (AMP-forming)/AMP-acid ligases II
MNYTLTLNGQTYSREELLGMALEGAESPKEYLRLFWNFIADWLDGNDYVEVSTSGSTGKPKKIRVLKQHMVNSARMTCDALGLQKGDSALLCLSTGYIAGKMMVVRAMVGGLDLTVVEPSGTPLIDKDYIFCAMVPMQVFNLAPSGHLVFTLNRISNLIIGGGAISSTLKKMIEPLTVTCYSTYGMTETVSHIALHRLNGSNRQHAYHPMPNVAVSLNEKGCLVIDAPLVTSSKLVTNDIAEVYPDGSFKILGRLDNIINTGGVKVSPEVVEAKLSGCAHVSFAISSVPDQRLGDMVVLVVEGAEDFIFNYRDVLLSYEMPKKIIHLGNIPHTPNGKVDRIALRKLISSQIF